jgi:HEPN domain-containing protein
MAQFEKHAKVYKRYLHHAQEDRVSGDFDTAFGNLFLAVVHAIEAWLAGHDEHSYGHEDRSIRLEKHIMMGRLSPEVLQAWEYFLTTVHGKGIYRLVLTRKDLEEAFRRAETLFRLVP